MDIIKTARGIEYRRQTFTDRWGRVRVCDKRLDTLPKPHAETCAVCGSAIAADRSTKRFCSDRCRVAAWRAAKKASALLRDSIGIVLYSGRTVK